MNKEIGWQKCLVFLLLGGFVPTLFSEEFDKSDWKDPRTRDEDISRTNISVEVSQLETGLYEYIYKISSSAENKGMINSFDVDVSCEADFGDVVMPPSDDTLFARESHSRDWKHVPVSVYGTDNAGTGNVGAENYVG